MPHATQAQYDATSKAAKQVALHAVMQAMLQSEPLSAHRGGAVGINNQHGIKAISKLPLIVIEIAIQYGIETGKLVTAQHDLNWYAEQNGYARLPLSPEYYVACVMLRVN